MEKSVKVKELASDEIYFIKPNATIIEAAKMMKKNNISSVIVVSEEKFFPIGIVTERDIVQRIVSEGKDPKKEIIKDHMTSPVLTINPDAKLIDAMKMMRAHSVKRLVMVKNKELEGMISFSDIVNVSPDLLEIISNKTRMECIEELKLDEETEIMPGICEICGAESDNLRENDEGLFVCEDCYE
ncbi:MAG: CBS domain-containing protein [Candidatus Helarchaeota archaeon]